MILKYAFAYVKSETGLEKHIMRYPQLFATYTIEKKLDEGNKKGIIWHTQGSGKTALTFYNVQYLTDYFQKKGVIPKFYFIVDRIDLMNQAKGEFSSRGLVVHTVDSREELLEDFKTQKVINNFSGKPEITVVNIQKFKDDPDLLRSTAYDLNIQRIYFLDEVHRSYKEEGSFLANLYTSDRSAILIGLTGTPLIGKDRKSRDTFGDYIHKYYYNDSIADGYTLKLIREGIESNYRIQLDKILNEIEVLKGDVDRKEIYAHERFVEPMLEYIVNDLTKSRIRFGDKTIGGMVICDSSEQAKKMYELFQSKYVKNGLTASVILHDIGDKDTRKEEVDKFKEGKIDLLFVYEMLLTGFDAKRLKKLYIGRIIRDHNLLQALTRVNRPYKDFRYGYVVDFADIRREFDKTNRAYFDELQLELGDEIKTYSNIFKSEEEIEKEIEEIKETLFQYDISNAEVFSQQISQIEDKKEILLLKKALENVNNLYNAIRLYGHVDLLDKIDFKKLHSLYGEASRRLDLLNLKESLEKGTSTTNLLNVALENVLFQFRKVSENELVIADKLKDILRKVREELGRNFDKQDPMFVTLYEELKRLFEKKNLDEISQEEMEENIKELRSIFDKATELNRKNNLLKAKYENDAKYARLHKKIMSDSTTPKKESHVHEVLVKIKASVDEKVLVNTNLLRNDDYFTQMTMQIVADKFGKSDIGIDTESLKNINSALAKEYMNEYGGMYA
jgi:type I restriction enzyme R subunit